MSKVQADLNFDLEKCILAEARVILFFSQTSGYIVNIGGPSGTAGPRKMLLRTTRGLQRLRMLTGNPVRQRAQQALYPLRSQVERPILGLGRGCVGEELVPRCWCRFFCW